MPKKQQRQNKTEKKRAMATSQFAVRYFASIYAYIFLSLKSASAHIAYGTISIEHKNHIHSSLVVLLLIQYFSLSYSLTFCLFFYFRTPYSFFYFTSCIHFTVSFIISSIVCIMWLGLPI